MTKTFCLPARRRSPLRLGVQLLVLLCVAILPTLVAPEPQAEAKAVPTLRSPSELAALGPGSRSTSSLAYKPLQTSASSRIDSAEECALIIPHKGRSRLYDHALGVLKGFAPFDSYGGHTCVTYDSVDEAFIHVSSKIHVRGPTGREWTTFEINPTGQIVVEVTRILAKMYGLSRDMVVHGLPLIDTSKTLLETICPDFLKPYKCEVKRYRDHNGLCNNLEQPTWGAARTSLVRLLPPAYPDGVDAPRVAVDGRSLPNPRIISAGLHRETNAHDHAITYFLVVWGQIIDHDVALAAITEDEESGEEPICCDKPRHQQHPNCMTIEIPEDDYFYSRFGRRCLEFLRSGAGQRAGCTLGPRTQMNRITSVLDANFVYGSSEEFANTLRTFRRGLLKSTPAFRDYGLKDLLPFRLDRPDMACMRPNRQIYCFEGGDVRVNEQLPLTVLHTIFMREHNRVATELGRINPHWDDETLYQESRHIVVAIVQFITYNEFLPLLLGRELVHKYELGPLTEGYFQGYDPKVNPGTLSSLLTAAFRMGHSLLVTDVERWSKHHKFVGSQRLSDLLMRPFDLYRVGWLDQYAMGMVNEVAQAMDSSVTQEVTNHLFKRNGERFGMDLAALNLQRAREHGVPGYNFYREYCGVGRARTFEDLLGTMPNETVRRYAEIYRHPDDIDLWSAGVSERPMPSAILGPTFACIMGLQFHNYRFGDRFWHENPGWPSSFTPAQLQEVRKMKLSRLICENTDNIDSMQVYAMVLPDYETNPRVPCKSGILPAMDLSKWKDLSYVDVSDY